MLGLHNLFNTLTGNGHKNKDQSNAPLYKAVKDGSVGEVKRLLKGGADPNIQDKHHLSPLHQAAYWGEKEIVELLLKHGAKADVDNGKGWSALHSAALSGGMKSRKEIIDLLLDAGAELEKSDKHGWTPLDYMALWETNAEAAAKLKDHLAHQEDQNHPSRPPKKPTKINTPKH